MEKLLQWVANTLIELILGLLIIFLVVHVVLDIATMFKLEAITSLSYIQVVGTVLIIRLLLLKGVKRKEMKEIMADKEPYEPVKALGYSLLGVFAYTMAVLIAWFIAIIIHAYLS